MDELIKIAVGFGTFWVIVTVVLFLWVEARLTKSIEHEYAQKLESFKAQLQAASEIQLEQLKSKLQIAVSERSIKFSNVFEKQALVIATLYKNLLALLDASQNYQGITDIMPAAEKQKLEDEFGKAKNEFTEHFFPNEIFVPKSTAKLIHKLALTQSRVVNYHRSLDQFASQPPTDNPSFEASLKRRLDEMEKFEREIPIIIEALRDEFQELLGIEDKSKETPKPMQKEIP